MGEGGCWGGGAVVEDDWVFGTDRIAQSLEGVHRRDAVSEFVVNTSKLKHAQKIFGDVYTRISCLG